MPHIVGLEEVSESDLSLVGGKASKLGELVRRGLPIPPGFVVTTELYQQFVDETPLKTEIPAALQEIDPNNSSTVEHASKRIRSAFESTDFPESLRQEIV
jgi:pyruvate, water dikinase